MLLVINNFVCFTIEYFNEVLSPCYGRVLNGIHILKGITGAHREFYWKGILLDCWRAKKPAAGDDPFLKEH